MTLREARLRLNMSAKELSELSGVNLRTIHAYEQGQISIRKASIDTLEKLATALRTNVNDIIDISKERNVSRVKKVQKD